MSEIRWEKAEAHGRKQSKPGIIRLATNDKGLYNRIFIPGDLAEKLPWVVGDPVWLYTSGNTLFKLSPEKSDIRVRKNGNGFVIGNQDFAQTIHGKAQVDEFRAWIDGDSIIFTPKEVA